MRDRADQLLDEGNAIRSATGQVGVERMVDCWKRSGAGIDGKIIRKQDPVAYADGCFRVSSSPSDTGIPKGRAALVDSARV